MSPNQAVLLILLFQIPRTVSYGGKKNQSTIFIVCFSCYTNMEQCLKIDNSYMHFKMRQCVKQKP